MNNGSFFVEQPLASPWSTKQHFFPNKNQYLCCLTRRANHKLNLESSIIMHPAQPSKARLGGVHFIFRHIQILTRLLQGELFRGYYVYCMHI